VVLPVTSSVVVSAEGLRRSAANLREADVLLGASELFLVGFDLEYLASRFEGESDRLEGGG
jgi:hypothetical protein